MSEYANRKDRGKVGGMVLGTQALGLIVGPVVARALLGAGASDDVAWRVLLGLGAVSAAAVIYLRRKMPESPRYQIQVQGQAAQAASQISDFTGGQVPGDGSSGLPQGMGVRAFLTHPRWLLILSAPPGTPFSLRHPHPLNPLPT